MLPNSNVASVQEEQELRVYVPDENISKEMRFIVALLHKA